MRTFMLLVIFSLNLFSCNDDDSTTTGITLTSSDLSGQWKITSLTDSGKDETYHFTGYVFTFGNGVVRAEKGGSLQTGAYVISTSSDGSSRWVLQFTDTEPWDELNEDWKVLEKSTSMIRLRHISGGNGGTDELTFRKI